MTLSRGVFIALLVAMATASCATAAENVPVREPNNVALYSDSSLPDWAEELGKGIARVMIIIIVLVFIVPAIIIVVIVVLCTCGACAIANRKKSNKGVVVTPMTEVNGGKVDQGAATYPPPAGQPTPMQPVNYAPYDPSQPMQPVPQPVPYYDQQAQQPQPMQQQQQVPQQPVVSTTA